MASRSESLLHRMHLKGPWVYRWLDGPHVVGEPVHDGTEGLVKQAEAAQPRGRQTDGEPESASPLLNAPLLNDSRVRMPSSWTDAFGAVCGRVLYSRRFNRPTRLDDDECVHIAFDAVGGRAWIGINGHEIGQLENTAQTRSFNISPWLQPSNELSVELLINADQIRCESGDQTSLGLHAPVAIEIHRVVPADS